MSTRVAAWLAWIAWAITFAMIVPSQLLELVNVGAEPLASNLLGALVYLTYATVGALIASRVPRNPIGWLLAGSALLQVFGGFAIDYAVYALLTRPGALPGGAVLGMLGGWARSVSFVVIVTFLLLLFPTGRLPSRRWRPLAWATLLAMVLFSVTIVLGGTLSEADQRLATVANPLGIIPTAIADGLQAVSMLLVFACVIGCCASVVARFRRARGVERQQVKWLAYAALWAAVAFFGAVVGAFTNNPVLASAVTLYLCLAGIPVAVGIAVLRHRLFDIDVLINRTLVYGSLTTILAALYFGCVVAMQAVAVRLSGEASLPPAAIVATTLLIAALFAPLRRRIQRFIDRRFYRGKYDAAKTLADFGATLRSETDLDDFSNRLLTVVERTMRPAHTSLWLRHSGGDVGRTGRE